MRRIALSALVVILLTAPVLGAGYSFLNVGIDYFNQGRYSDAILWLDKAIAAGDLVPDQMHVAYIDRGLAHARQREIPSAISDYTAALALKPNDGFIARERAFAYMSLGQYENAIPDLSAAHLKYPDNLQIDFQAGLANWRLGRYADASAIFSRLTHRATTAWFWMQLSNVRAGAPLASIEDKNFDPNPWPNPIAALYAGKISEESVLKATQHETFAPAGEVCDANFYIGEWHLAHGEMSASKPMLQKAAEICPDASTEKTMALFEIRNLAEAKK